MGGTPHSVGGRFARIGCREKGASVRRMQKRLALELLYHEIHFFQFRSAG